LKFLKRALCILLVLSSINVEAGPKKKKKTDESSNNPKEFSLYGKRSRENEEEEKESEKPTSKKKSIFDSEINKNVQLAGTFEYQQFFEDGEVPIIYPVPWNPESYHPNYDFLYSDYRFRTSAVSPAYPPHQLLNFNSSFKTSGVHPAYPYQLSHMIPFRPNLYMNPGQPSISYQPEQPEEVMEVRQNRPRQTEVIQIPAEARSNEVRQTEPIQAEARSIQNEPKQTEVVLDEPRSAEAIQNEPKQTEVVLDEPRSAEAIQNEPKQTEVVLDEPRSAEAIQNEPKQTEVVLDEPRSAEAIQNEPKQTEVVLAEPRPAEAIQNKPKQARPDEVRQTEFRPAYPAPRPKKGKKIYNEEKFDEALGRILIEDQTMEVSLIVYMQRKLLGDMSIGKLGKITDIIRKIFPNVEIFSSTKDFYKKDRQFIQTYHNLIIICEVKNHFSKEQTDAILDLKRSLDVHLFSKIFLFNVSDCTVYRVPSDPSCELTFHNCASSFFRHFFKVPAPVTRYFIADEECMSDMLSMIQFKDSHVMKNYNIEANLPQYVKEVEWGKILKK